MASSYGGCCGITRRGFLLGAASGLGVGLPAAWYGSQVLPPVLSRFGLGAFGGSPREDARPRYAMPGRYPGRVVEVRHPAAVTPHNEIRRDVVATLVDRGMAELTGTDPRDVRGSWGTFF